MSASKRRKKQLRSGYTTGACSAAVAKGATLLLLQDQFFEKIEIPFPDGSRHKFILQRENNSEDLSMVSTVKDAGDDPDVTNGAVISATANWCSQPPAESIEYEGILIQAGSGIGRVTKPGLAVEPGEPAINPVPRQMIAEAVHEAFAETGQILHIDRKLYVTISVAKGEELAQKTLNERLGIIGGISILGTTGIVQPVSADAWKATITTSMDVAKSAGLDDIVISTGRTSERGAQRVLNLPDEAYAMMGDYLHFSLQEAGSREFSTIHYAGMWAKIMKAALNIPQTHVRHGALEIKEGVELLGRLGAEELLCKELQDCNTAREILFILLSKKRNDLIEKVCRKAQNYAEQIADCQVKIYLIDHKARIIFHTP